MSSAIRRTMFISRTRALPCCALGAVFLAACSDSPAPDPASPVPPRALVRTDPARAEDCLSGGSVVSSGYDRNGDGMLQDVEITKRTPVCNPAPDRAPPVILVRLVPVASGMQCPAGGTAVRSGPDRNGNGQLDDDEVAHTDYLCTPGAITDLVAEPPGARCAAGGVVFRAGLDRDADHVLDEDEVDSAELECGDVVTRDVEIRTDADVAALAAVRSITGALVMHSTELSSVSLPRLEHIGGRLDVQGELTLTTLALPELQEVEGPVTMHFADLTTAAWPKLHRVGGLDLQFISFIDLSVFASLTEITGDVRVTDMAHLRAVDLAGVSIGGGLSIRSNNALTQVTLKLADHVGGVVISDNPQLETIDIAALARQNTSSEIGDVALFFNDKLARLAVSADALASLQIDSSPRITSVSLDVARVRDTVSMFDGREPFDLTLSSPRGDRVEFGAGLIISGPLAALESTAPVVVNGLCVFDHTLLTTIDLRARLSELRGGVRLSENERLVDVSLLGLRAGLQLIHNAVLRSIEFRSLLDPGELAGVVITKNPMLREVPLLDQVVHVGGSVDVEDNPALASLFGPALAWIEGDLIVDRNASLLRLELSQLQHVLAMDVSQNPLLESLLLPALLDARDQLFIFSNRRLRHLALDSLHQSNFMDVAGNPMLPACAAAAVCAHVAGTCLQSENDGAGACAP